MHINQKILELIGLVQAVQRLHQNLDGQAELLEVTIKTRDEILEELSINHIKDSAFLTPQEKEQLLRIKEGL